MPNLTSVKDNFKIHVFMNQKVLFVLAYFQVSATPRLENPDSDEKDALFRP
jgi:hypothetical protein